MNRYDEVEQDRPLDDSTSAKLQHFDSAGYVVHDDNDDVRDDERDSGVSTGDERDAASHEEVPDQPGALGGRQASDETDDPAADDGLFNDQQMPTADGELSDPDPDAGLADDETDDTTGGSPMTNADGTLDDDILSQPDEVIAVDDPSLERGPEPVPAAPDGVPIDPDYAPSVQPGITPDEPMPPHPEEPLPPTPAEPSLPEEGNARDVPNPAL